MQKSHNSHHFGGLEYFLSIKKSFFFVICTKILTFAVFLYQHLS